MAKNEVKITLTGDASDVVKEYKKMQAEQDKHQEKIEKAKQSTKMAAQETRQHQSIARKAWKETATEVEKVEKEIKELNAAYQAGHVPLETYNRKSAQLDDRLVATQGKGKKLNGTLAQLKSGFGGLTGSVTGASGGLGSLVTKAGVATGAIAALTAALAKANQRNRALLEKEGQSYVDVDKQVTNFMAQGGRDSSSRRGLTDTFLNIAETNRADVGLVTGAATAFESSGFAGSEANGLLDLYVKAAQSANADEVDPEQIIKPIAQFLEATNQKATKENFSDVLVRGRGLFSSGKFEFGDLGQVAKIAPGLTASGEDMETTLALFASLRESLSAEVASTGIKGIVGKLQSAPKEGSARRKAVESLGLNVDDIDLAGESIEVALSRIGAAAKNVDEQTKNVAFGEIFGLESKDAAIKLISAVESGDVEKRRQMQRDVAGFNQGVELKQTGAAAEDRASRVTTIRTDLNRRDEALTERLAQQQYERESQARTQQAAASGTAALLYNEAVEGYSGYANWIEGSARNRLTNEGAASVRGAVESAGGTVTGELGGGYNISGADTSATVVEQRRTNELLEQMAGRFAGSEPGSGTTATESPVNNTPIQREDTPLPIGGAYGATP